MKSQKFYRKGFVLPLAMIAVSIMLTASFAASVLIIGEIEFSILSRESQRSFFAADAGAECALYWDLKEYAFATDTPQSSAISCVGLTQQINRVFTPPDIYSWEFPLIVFSNGAEVDVLITKRSYPAITTVVSRGYNASSGTKNLVERTIQVTY